MRKKELLIIFATLLYNFFITQLRAEDNWKNKVYLATYPRSGNHWVRHLIEEATHIATSSVYRDRIPPHLDVIFPWGGYCAENGYEGHCRYPQPDEAVVIKTHFPCYNANQFDSQPYFKVIRVIRHPVDSIYSYYLFLNQGHPPTSYIPQNQLKELIASWRRFQSYWNNQPEVLNICYEDMCQNPKPYLKKILDAIGYTVTNEDIERAIAKHPPQVDFLKHRRHFPMHDLTLIKNELNDLMTQYGYQITTIEFQSQKDL